jgi:hypothetical protein
MSGWRRTSQKYTSTQTFLVGQKITMSLRAFIIESMRQVSLQHLQTQHTHPNIEHINTNNNTQKHRHTTHKRTQSTRHTRAVQFTSIEFLGTILMKMLSRCEGISIIFGLGLRPHLSIICLRSASGQVAVMACDNSQSVANNAHDTTTGQFSLLLIWPILMKAGLKSDLNKQVQSTLWFSYQPEFPA